MKRKQNNKLKIIEFCPVPPPYGGVTVFVKRLSDKLRNDGYSVGGYYTDDCKDINVVGSPLYYKVIQSSSSSKIIKLFVKVYRTIRYTYELSHFNIIHYHGLENMDLIWLLKFVLKKQVMITVHSAMIEEFYAKTSFYNKYFLRKIAESDTEWIAVSEQAKQCMLRLPFHFCQNIHVIAAYIPIESRMDIPLSDEMMAYLNEHEKNIAFYARSFMTHNGIDVYGIDDTLLLYAKIVESCDNKIGLVFCMSEDTNKYQIQKLFDKARKMGIYDKIFWQIGAIDNINNLWRNVDIYIRPTSTDGDSVAVREVLDQGVHVIASDVCWRPEGVLTYRWKNNDSLFEQVLLALSMPKKKPTQNFACYDAMKSIIDNCI